MINDEKGEVGGGGENRRTLCTRLSVSPSSHNT